MSSIQIFFLVLGWLSMFYFLGRNEQLKKQLKKNIEVMENSKKKIEEIFEFKIKFCEIHGIGSVMSLDQIINSIKKLHDGSFKMSEDLSKKTEMITKIENELSQYSDNKFVTALGLVKFVLVKVKQQKECIDELKEETKEAKQFLSTETELKESAEGDISKIRKAFCLGSVAPCIVIQKAIDIQNQFNICKNNTETDRKSYLTFIDLLKEALEINNSEIIPSGIITIVEKLKKNENLKVGEQDLYYKKNLLEEFKKVAVAKSGMAFHHAISMYTSPQRIKIFQSFDKKTSAKFKGDINTLKISDFNIKNK